MKNLSNYKDFINESKRKEIDSVSLFKKDVDSIINDMFEQAKKKKFEYDVDGFPTSVEFEVVYNDWFCEYDDPLKNEFSEGVLKKREFEPVMVFVSKDQEGKDKDKDKNIYKLKFKIKKEKVDHEAILKSNDKKRSEQFEKDSDEQLLKKLKSNKISDLNKEKIMDILKDRGVDYKNPFEEEDDDISEEDIFDMIWKNELKKSKKKNESLEFLNESQMNNLSLIAQESESFDEFRLSVMKEYPELFKGSIEEQEEVNNWLENIYEQDIIEEGKKSCGCGDPKPKTEPKKCDKCGKEECECDKGEPKKCECGKQDCVKCNESLNEGLLGKLAKFFSKAEYEKTLKHCLNACKEECTKEKVKNAMKNMVFSKITKKSLDEDSKLMNSLVDEIYKDCKKEMTKKESFGSEEWQKKYGVEIKEEKSEPCLECIVNETLKIKKVDDMESLNDIFNKVYEENKIVENLNTIKK